jgi:hypothetical protein
VRAPQKETQDEKQVLFNQITEDYISKILKLGYSLEDMTAKLQKRAKETGKERKKKNPQKKGDKMIK